MKVFLTITSSVFSELVIVLAGRAMPHLPKDVGLFETLRKMNGIRPFELVFVNYLSVQDRYQREAQLELVQALDLVAANGLLDFLDSPPTIRSA
jgi:hypothetical protein